jgi:transcriptional regulator with AAA-type ATPase domain
LTNKEKVFNYISNTLNNINKNNVLKNHSYGVNADYLSRNLGISRANISYILNELVRENLLVKLISRPVYYLTKDKAEELIGKPIKESVNLKDFIKLIEEVDEGSKVEIKSTNCNKNKMA